MIEQKRHCFQKLEGITGTIFGKLPFSPNFYTLSALFLAGASFFFLAKLEFAYSALSFTIAGVLDFVDGAVARKTNKVSKKGAYLDTICDRYAEAIMLSGFFDL